MSSVESDKSLLQYRSLSWAAVLALLLALLSMVAVFNPLLVIVAFAGTGLSLIALRQIYSKPDVLSGRGVALAALFLSVFSLVFAPTRAVTRSRLLQQRAQQLAEAFLGYLQEGKTFDAHQLSNLKHIDLSQPPPEPGTDTSKLTKSDFQAFEEKEIIASIKAIQHHFSFRLEAIESQRTYNDMEVFIFRYRLDPDAGTGKKSFPVWITISRAMDRMTLIPSWRVIDVQKSYKPST